MYYTLGASAEPKTNGCYPQIVLADYSKEEFVYSLSLDELWDEEIKFDFFKFNDKFIDTDFCTIGHFNATSGIVVSEKVKSMLEQVIKDGYKFTTHRFFPFIIPNTAISKNYYFLQILDSKELIDYSNTIFKNLLTEEQVTIKSHSNHDVELDPLKVQLRKNLDLFKHPYDIEIFISERLKDLIEQNKFTGYEDLRAFSSSVYELLGPKL